MKIVFLSSEIFPFSKTGGLADVSGGLPKALKEKGHNICVFTPYYFCCEKFGLKQIPGAAVKITVGDDIYDTYLYETKIPDSNVTVFFVDNKYLYFRERLYGKYGNIDYEDNFTRFVVFQRSVIEFMKLLNIQPDIVHANDWQTALTPVYLRTIYADFFQFTISLIKDYSGFGI